MKIESFNDNLDFNSEKVVTKVLLETSFSKEIRILIKKGQVMKEHKAPFPIIVHILDGEINFGVSGQIYSFISGNAICLDANEPHDLVAMKDSIVRLTLSKLDRPERFKKVIN